LEAVSYGDNETSVEASFSKLLEPDDVGFLPLDCQGSEAVKFRDIERTSPLIVSQSIVIASLRSVKRFNMGGALACDVHPSPGCVLE
jgi:hypothetical protein